jgi:UDP-N-acetylglucosamine 4,6-dehydratase
MLETSNLFVTGGAGYLGRAIARRRKAEGWTGKLTVYSRDDHKHQTMRREFPDVQFVQGDIRNLETLKMAMVGHDAVIHAAAAKVIPVSEYQSIDTIDINVFGSQNVCMAARETGIKHVLGISTDKACNPANAYGATKYLMEKIAQEYARAYDDPVYHLVRYGNVLESTGSVVEAWKRAAASGEPVFVTDPEMTRFWMSPEQAVDCVVEAFEFMSGQIYIPRLPSLSIGDLLEHVVGMGYHDIRRVPLRPGEKIHETLLTREEIHYVDGFGKEYFLLSPTTSEWLPNKEMGCEPYTSDTARRMDETEIQELLSHVTG